MADSLIVINADGPETRVALVEDGYLGELYIERKRERGIAGNIKKHYSACPASAPMRQIEGIG